MDALLKLILTPLALPFRFAAAQPWVAIGVSGVLGLGAFLIRQEIAGFVLVSYMAYVMIWMDEVARPRAIDEGVAAGD